MADDFRQFSRGDVISGRFEIEDRLARDPLADTYRARNTSTGKMVSLQFFRPKFVGPDRLNNLQSALKKVSDLRIDGVSRAEDASQHDGIVYIISEHFADTTLRDLLDEYHDQQQSFTLQEACQLVLKILDALEALHQAGIIHGHLTPERVLVNSRSAGPGGSRVVRTVQIVDAGLGRLLAATGADNTSPYRAPELGLGTGTPPADVYSVGVMFYELLVGQTPRGTYLSPTQLRGDMPETIDDIVEFALAANAEDRYKTARDMASHIKRTFSGDVFDDAPSTSFRTVLLAVGAAVVVIAMVGVYFALRETPDPVLQAAARDEEIRRDVQAQIVQLSEEEMAVLNAEHPEMLYIPAGPVIMGRLNQEDLSVASQSEPLTQIAEVAAFYIDRFEFPNRLKEKPVARVSYKDARAACEQVGKRLCTEQEWEKACKGPGNWIYSYGDTYDPEMCGGGVDEKDYTIGALDTCVSGYGVWGMSGGPREWTDSAAGSSGKRRVVKGGMRANNERGTRCAFSVDESDTYADRTLSFRCCLDFGKKAEPREQ
ncbi:MAG: SUMF1/EgtB/PvdO family nonheme iron enzyme [Myxococcota bacterium]